MKKFFLALMMGVPMVVLTAQSSTTNTQGTNEFKKETTSSSEQVKSPVAELPGFPVYRNTGNTESSNSDYQAAKAKWISENQQLYNDYLASLGQADSKTNLSELPGFPQLVNTGNPDVDNNNYREAKILWIQNNQDLYNSYIQNTKSNNNTRTNTAK